MCRKMVLGLIVLCPCVLISTLMAQDMPKPCRAPTARQLRNRHRDQAAPHQKASFLKTGRR